MFELKNIASGSEGNAYLVKADNLTFLLDAGVSINDITNVINLNNLDFAFISHSHQDHIKCVEDLKKRNIKVIEGSNIEGWKSIRELTNYESYAFNVEHGNVINSGFIIKTKNECILYITDFNVCKWILKDFKFTQIIIECNYIESWLTSTLKEATDNYKLKLLRQQNTHLGLDGLCLFLDNLDLTQTKGIYLVHASSDSRISNTIVMASKVLTRYTIDTYVCKRYGGLIKYGRG